MSYDQLICETKIAIMDSYDDTKYKIEIDCQDVLKSLSDKNKDTKDVLKQFEHSLKLNEDIHNHTMLRFNDYIANEENLENKTKADLMKIHMHSTLYLIRKDMRKKSEFNQTIEEDNEDETIEEEGGVNALFHCNWFLDENQINYFKVRWLKRELTKDINLCLNEVNYKLKYFFKITFVFNFYI